MSESVRELVSGCEREREDEYKYECVSKHEPSLSECVSE